MGENAGDPLAQAQAMHSQPRARSADQHREASAHRALRCGDRFGGGLSSTVWACGEKNAAAGMAAGEGGLSPHFLCELRARGRFDGGDGARAGQRAGAGSAGRHRWRNPTAAQSWVSDAFRSLA